VHSGNAILTNKKLIHAVALTTDSLEGGKGSRRLDKFPVVGYNHIAALHLLPRYPKCNTLAVRPYPHTVQKV